jgi:transcriptional regulator GlxA family with amidase domain
MILSPGPATATVADLPEFRPFLPQDRNRATVVSVPVAIGLGVLDEVTDSGVSIALDVFRAANALRTRTGGTPPFTVQVGSVDGRPVRTASGLRLGVHGDLASLRECDVFLVPGCWVEGDEAVARFLTRPDVGEVGAALR